MALDCRKGVCLLNIIVPYFVLSDGDSQNNSQSIIEVPCYVPRIRLVVSIAMARPVSVTTYLGKLWLFATIVTIHVVCLPPVCLVFDKWSVACFG